MSSVNRSSVARCLNHEGGRDEEDPPDQPSLAEFMLEMEKNKHYKKKIHFRDDTCLS